MTLLYCLATAPGVAARAVIERLIGSPESWGLSSDALAEWLALEDEREAA